MMLNLILQTICCCCYITLSENIFRVDIIDVVSICVHKYVCVYECVVLYMCLLFICHQHCFAYDPRLGFIMQLIENLPCNIGLIMRSGIIPAWHCSCVSVISQCLLKLYHRLIGCTVTFHVISTFHWLNDVTLARKRA